MKARLVGTPDELVAAVELLAMLADVEVERVSEPPRRHWRGTRRAYLHVALPAQHEGCPR